MAEPIADQQPREGVAFCTHCDWFFKYEMASEDQKLAAGLLAVHARGCQANPLVRERDALKAALTTYGRHDASCRIWTRGCAVALPSVTLSEWPMQIGTGGMRTPTREEVEAVRCTCGFAALALAEGQ